jgi:uncharacterized protein YndB with AHSA1/START domain
MKKALRILLVLVALLLLALGISYVVSGGPSTVVSKVHIRQQPDAVFNFISDMRNELKWNPDVLYMEKTSEGPVGLGTRFRAKWHMSDTVDIVLKRYEPPLHATFENGGPVEVSLQITLTPASDGTDLEADFIATPHGFIRAIFPLFKAQIAKQEQENMINLKKALEK